MGVSRSDVRGAALLEKTRESVGTMVELTRSDDFRDGLAALYAYESQVPMVAKTKREGLAKFYNLDDDRSIQFFTVHEEADIEHSRVERELLVEHCATESSRTAPSRPPTRRRVRCGISWMVSTRRTVTTR
jgi:pyrroloquinoline-quinone synthase